MSHWLDKFWANEYWADEHWVGDILVLPGAPSLDAECVPTDRVAGTLVDYLYARVRDPGGTATGRSFVRLLLSRAQQSVNAALNLLTDELSVNTTANQQIYNLTSLSVRAVRLLSVREAGRDLAEIDWRKLAHIDRQWLKRTGNRFEAWAPIGRDLFVIHPAKVEASTATLVYTRHCAVLTTDDSELEVPDFAIPHVLDLAEVMLLVKMREFGTVKGLLEQLATRLLGTASAQALDLHLDGTRDAKV